MVKKVFKCRKKKIHKAALNKCVSQGINRETVCLNGLTGMRYFFCVSGEY